MAVPLRSWLCVRGVLIQRTIRELVRHRSDFKKNCLLLPLIINFTRVDKMFSFRGAVQSCLRLAGRVVDNLEDWILSVLDLNEDTVLALNQDVTIDGVTSTNQHHPDNIGDGNDELLRPELMPLDGSLNKNIYVRGRFE